VSWFVYVLRSEVSERLYTGISTDVDRRLLQHNSGTGAKCTRAGRPWKIVYVEPAVSKGAALRREAEIKRYPRAKKLLLVGDRGHRRLEAAQLPA
jgi:putative endonuclease